MSVEQQVQMTAEEKRRLEQELTQLISVKRPEIAGKIGRAAADGDLSENGAYHDAKEQQAHIEGRIAELEYVVRNAVVVEPQADAIGLGNLVHIKDESGGERSFRVVSKLSARPSEGLLSDESPLGAALLGHVPGESVSYQTPAGQSKTVTILSIE